MKSGDDDAESPHRVASYPFSKCPYSATQGTASSAMRKDVAHSGEIQRIQKALQEAEPAMVARACCVRRTRRWVIIK